MVKYIINEKGKINLCFCKTADSKVTLQEENLVLTEPLIV